MRICNSWHSSSHLLQRGSEKERDREENSELMERTTDTFLLQTFIVVISYSHSWRNKGVKCGELKLTKLFSFCFYWSLNEYSVWFVFSAYRQIWNIMCFFLPSSLNNTFILLFNSLPFSFSFYAFSLSSLSNFLFSWLSFLLLSMLLFNFFHHYCPYFSFSFFLSCSISPSLCRWRFSLIH